MILGSQFPTHAAKSCPKCVPQHNAAPPPRPAFGSRAGQINTALLVLVFGGIGLSVALRTVILNVVGNTERIAKIEQEISHNPIDSAKELLERMVPSAQRKAQMMSAGISLTRPCGIQMELLKEHLEWLNQGHTDRQIVIVQVVVMAGAIERAIDAIDNPSDEQQKHIGKILAHKEAGMKLLKKKLRELGEVTDREMRFQL